MGNNFSTSIQGLQHGQHPVYLHLSSRAVLRAVCRLLNNDWRRSVDVAARDFYRTKCASVTKAPIYSATHTTSLLR